MSGYPESMSGRRYAIDAACIGAALALGLLGLFDAYGGSAQFLLAAFGGLAAGLGLAWANRHYRLGFWTTAALLLLSYLVLGTPLATPREAFAGALPTLDSLRTLVTGVALSWKDMLTVAPPVGALGGVLIVAFLSALLSSFSAGLLAWRRISPFWTLIPLLAMYVVGIVFGTQGVPLPLLRGLAFTAIVVGWLAWRRRLNRVSAGRLAGGDAHGETGSTTTGRWGTVAGSAVVRRVVGGAAVLAVAGGLTAVAAPWLAGENPRQVLRDAVDPPVDLYDYPSPLTSFRRYVKDMAEEPLFTVEGLPEGRRVRLAALGSYNGMVLNVDPSSGGNFAPVGDTTDIRSGTTAAGREGGTLEIRIEAYDGVWLPGGGKLAGLEVSGDGSERLSRSLFYNDELETALSTTGLREGDVYTAQVLFPARPSDEELAEARFSEERMPDLLNVPPAVTAKAPDFVGTAADDFGRARNLEAALKTGGYFSNGTEGQVPSLSGHGAGRLSQLLDAEDMIGDDEQYAVAMALMAREQGMPARVVMGFYPEEYAPGEPVAITGSDVHAWVEIAFEEHGWVAFDPTPDEDQQPTPPEQEPKSVPQPQVLQPPPPAQDEADLPPETAPEPQDLENEPLTFWERWGTVILVVGISLGTLLLLMAPLLLIAALKLRRRRRRFTTGTRSERLGGGWHEVLSQAADLGVVPAVGATRRESATALTAGFPAAGLSVAALAARADRATFGAEEPTEEEIARYWDDVDGQLRSMTEPLGFWQRQRAKYSPRSLLHDAATRLAERRAAARSAAGGPVAERLGEWWRRAADAVPVPGPNRPPRGGNRTGVRKVNADAPKE
ncbi:transglutaminase domain-containing protein [Zhihengliuella sp.]|uniref:transglutaminase family protein n=1 Tax=Zhihengliuella sp. TaxID=1954483 RepID=UPI0028111760|nr:transglutaminase domain-containing protein [Zhihengliuella sp.]